MTANVVLSRPVQFTEALQSRDVRNILPTTLSSAELEQIETAILERAMFSARVNNAVYLQAIDDMVGQLLRGEIDLATARLFLKEKLRELGYQPTPDEAGTIKDLASDARTNLVLETPMAMAGGYGQWLQGQNKVVLDQWPAQQLYRAYGRKVPRPWPARWSQHGGKFFDEHGEAEGGRMIALKNTEIWTAISRFGTPYPPFDFNSGMRVRDIDRDTAVSLGLIDRDTQIAPQDRGFNDDLRFTPDIRSAALRQALVEEGYNFDGDVLTLGGNG